MVRNCCIACFLFSFMNVLCSMVLTSTKLFLLSLLFAVWNKLHLFLLTHHCQMLCPRFQMDFGCRASARTPLTPRMEQGSGGSGTQAAEKLWNLCRHPNSATAPGCVCNSTHRDSQRSHGMSSTLKNKRFQGCSIHKNTCF